MTVMALCLVRFVMCSYPARAIKRRKAVNNSRAGMGKFEPPLGHGARRALRISFEAEPVFEPLGSAFF
jgi:hypothetical protein